MVGASLQSSQVETVQENAEISQTTTESSKSLNEMVGSEQEASTENLKQTNDEVTTQPSKAADDDNEMVGMALPLVKNDDAATPDKTDATQIIAESEVQNDATVSAPLETSTDQTHVDEKVRKKW